MQSETCGSKRIFFWICLTLLMSLQIAPLHCSYIDQKALYLGEIPTAHDGRIILVRHRAQLWWAKKAHPKCKWPQIEKEEPIQKLSPYSSPLSLYLSLCLLPKVDPKSADQICYIALPKELKQLGLKGVDLSGHYTSYEMGLTSLKEMGQESLERYLATAHYKKLLAKEHSSWKVVGKHLLPRASLQITTDLPVLWVRQRLGYDIATKSLPLHHLPLSQYEREPFQVDPAQVKIAEALEGFIYSLVDHEQFASANPPHLLLLPSEDTTESFERWHSLLVKPSPFMGGYGNEASTFYSMLEEAPTSGDLYFHLKDQMRTAYRNLQKTDRASNKSELLATAPIPLPALWQLEIAATIESIPGDIIATCLWAIALIASLFSGSGALFRYSFVGALSWLTLILSARIIALERPPVSNMYETLLYVPWVIAIASMATGLLKESEGKKLRTPVIAAILGCSLFSLSIDVERALMPAIAVLNSSFWLTTHVLLVVGSYGILLFASALSHRDLFLSFVSKGWEDKTRSSRKSALTLIQWGTSALVVGTLLGGVWAAQSWGRFWDWDPKESWALITSAYYLILIHLSRFYPISAFLFSLINAAGALFITFTWYGVNYILGVGLHSYGFGSDSHIAYALYVSLELLFLAAASWRQLSKKTAIK